MLIPPFPPVPYSKFNDFNAVSSLDFSSFEERLYDFFVDLHSRLSKIDALRLDYIQRRYRYLIAGKLIKQNREREIRKI